MSEMFYSEVKKEMNRWKKKSDLVDHVCGKLYWDLYDMGMLPVSVMEKAAAYIVDRKFFDYLKNGIDGIRSEVAAMTKEELVCAKDEFREIYKKMLAGEKLSEMEIAGCVDKSLGVILFQYALEVCDIYREMYEEESKKEEVIEEEVEVEEEVMDECHEEVIEEVSVEVEEEVSVEREIEREISAYRDQFKKVWSKKELLNSFALGTFLLKNKKFIPENGDIKNIMGLVEDMLLRTDIKYCEKYRGYLSGIEGWYQFLEDFIEEKKKLKKEELCEEYARLCLECRFMEEEKLFAKYAGEEEEEEEEEEVSVEEEVWEEVPVWKEEEVPVLEEECLLEEAPYIEEEVPPRIEEVISGEECLSMVMEERKLSKELSVEEEEVCLSKEELSVEVPPLIEEEVSVSGVEVEEEKCVLSKGGWVSYQGAPLYKNGCLILC